MGRKKITIQQITDPKLRNITYNKRKNGLIKKAAEISLLCNINLMLVFEDLNGNLVQFSRNQIKNISNFTNDCHYKRVLELTAEDYPDFSKIKRHKKKQGIPEQSSSQTQSVSGNVRTFTDMHSDQDSIIAKEEVFNDFENIGNTFSSMDIFNGLSDLTNYGDNRLSALSTSWFQPDFVNKKVKPNTQIQPQAQVNLPQSSSPTSQHRNKLGLRLKISNNEENAVKEAVNSQGSRKKGSSHNKPGSSQKNSYSRRSNFDPNANQINLKTFYDFMNEEGLVGDFSEFSPFSSQIFRPSPNMKYMEGGEMMTNQNIVNCLTNSGRNSLNQRNASTFQQYMDNSYDHGYGMEAEIGSTKKQNYMEQLSGRDSRVETAAPTESVSGRRYVFNGFFNSDQMFAGIGETKLM